MKGNQKLSEGICYRDAHSFVGKCKREAGNAAIAGGITVSSLAAVNTLALCKAECANIANDCNAYDFKVSDSTCRYYKMGVSKVIGSTTASDGTCYSKPLAPLINDGACIQSDGTTAIPTTKVTT